MLEAEARANAARAALAHRQVEVAIEPAIEPAPMQPPMADFSYAELPRRVDKPGRRARPAGGSGWNTLGFLLVAVVLVGGIVYGLSWALNGERGLLSLAVGIGAPPLPTPLPAAASPSPRPTLLPTPAPRPTALVYVVQAGDTLTKIARQHDTTVDDLVSANGLDPRGVLSVGRELVIQKAAPTPASGR